MARIPDPYGQRVVARPSGFADLPGGESTASGVAGLGRRVRLAAEEVGASSEKFEAAKANSAFLQSQIAAEEEIQATGDYDKWRDDYQTRMEASIEAAGKGLSGRARQLFDLDARDSLARGQARIGVAATARREDAQRASLDELLANNLTAAMKGGGMDLVNASNAAITSAVGAGYLRAEVGVALRQKFGADYAFTKLAGLVDDDPEAAMKALDGGQWDRFLDPQTKAKFTTAAQAKIDEQTITTTSAGIAEAMQQPFFGGAVDLIAGFESFRNRPYWDVNAHRAGFGSDTYTTADGQVHKVTPESWVTWEDGQRDIQRRVGEFAGAAREKVGAAQWDVLPENAKSALTSIAYNYGSIPDRLVPAIRSGDTIAIAAAVEGLQSDNDGVNAKRRQNEAEIIRSSDSDALLADRLKDVDPSLRGSVAKEVAALWSLDEAARQRRQAAADLAKQQQQAELEIGISRGELGYAQIDRAYASGVLSPDQYTALTKQKDEAVAKAMNDAEDLDAARAKLQAGDWNAYDPDQKKMVNTLFDASDQSPQTGIALTVQTGIAPDATVATIRQGIAAKDQQTYTTASQIEDAAPNALPEDVRRQVGEFRAFTRLGYTAEDAIRRANRTEDEKIAFKVLDPQVAKEVGKLGVADTKLSGWFGADVSEAATPALMADFGALYSEARRDGLSAAEAAAVAQEQIGKTWGPSEVSGSAQVVRHPPERYYRMSPETIAGQAKVDAMGLDPTAESVDLRADYVTDSDIKAGRPPRYRLFWTDADGVVHAAPGHFQAVEPSQGDAKMMSEVNRKGFENERRKADRRFFLFRGLRPPNTPEKRRALREKIETEEQASKVKEIEAAKEKAKYGGVTEGEAIQNWLDDHAD